jgi:predicted lactoylglutathione lyase
MFDHIQIKVEDFERGKNFYGEVLATLGYSTVFENEGVIGFGVSTHNMFEVRQADKDAPLSQNVHIAFAALTVDMVKKWYEKALTLGAKSNGVPGLRPEYEEGYYAAFVIDPFGHNLEAVYMQK